MKRQVRIVKCMMLNMASGLILLTLLFSAFILVTACSFTGNVVKAPSVVQDTGTIEAHMCPVENCSQVFREEVERSTTVDCALYDLSDRAVMDALAGKKARIAIDAKSYFGLGRPVHTAGIMHDKFCIFDGRRVLSGSYNPTALGERHANNIVIIESAVVARNFQDEFEELWKDVPQERKARVKTPIVNLTGGIDDIGTGGERGQDGMTQGIIVETYFCPEDRCEERVLSVLGEAKGSVHFMTFAFTSDAIGKYLASRKGGLDIKGVFERQQLSQWSEDKRLLDAKIPFVVDKSPYLMHDKVFIVDGKTVITGSFNPTKNADENNDENVVVIRDAGIAQEYEQEFSRLWERDCQSGCTRG